MIVRPFEMCKKSSINPNFWEKVDDSFKITKPTVFCIGGNRTNTIPKAIGVGKIAGNLIGLKEKSNPDEYATGEDVDIISVAYVDVVNKIIPMSTLEKRCDVSEFEEMFSDQMLLPLVSTDDGKRLPTDTACKNATLVTFFSHCFGSILVRNVVLSLQERMVDLGYSVEEQSLILGQITSVNYAPLGKTDYIQRFNIKTLRDTVISNHASYEIDTGKSFFSLQGNELVINKPAPSNPNPNSFTLYSKELANDVALDSEHFLSILDRRAMDWKLETDIDSKLTYVGQNADQASQCAGYVLAKSVATGIENLESENFIPKPSTEEMFKTCCEIVGQRTCDPAMRDYSTLRQEDSSCDPVQ